MMKCSAAISWRGSSDEVFTDARYSRVHQWEFDGGLKLAASSSPDIVPLPMSDPSCIDPEESFVASIASCHMLFFLSFCAKEEYVVLNYEDHAEGYLGEGVDHRKQFLNVVLRPFACFGKGNAPTHEKLEQLHEKAHQHCFI